MSFSFSVQGPISGPAGARITIRNYHEQDNANGRDCRNAKAAVQAELDHLESMGVTHVKASAAGHGGSWRIDVAVDADAQAAHQALIKQRAYDQWQALGEGAGHFDKWLTENSMAGVSEGMPDISAQKASS